LWAHFPEQRLVIEPISQSAGKKKPSYERQLEALHFIVTKKRNLSDRRDKTGKKISSL